MMTIAQFIETYSNDDSFKSAIEELKKRPLDNIVAICENTDGSPANLVTYAPREMDIKYMRLEELVAKMDDGNVDLTDEEQNEADEICKYLGYDGDGMIWAVWDVGKINT